MINLINKILKVFDDNHLWNDGVELIGSWCFLLYQKHFDVKKYPFRTMDIDFLIPYPFKTTKKIDLAGLLEELGFKVSFNSDGSIFLWNSELKIEFITAQKGREQEKAIEIKGLSLKAIPLRYTDILLENPVKVIEDGITVLIPNPAAFALHKLLISEKRKNNEKRSKDIEQALFVLEAIKLNDALKIYRAFPKPWKKSILKTLEKSEKQFFLHKHIIQKVLSTLQSS
jgi:hypothetical protein